MKPHMACALALLCFAAGPRYISAAANEEKLESYAEWRRADYLIIDGPRVQWQPKEKFNGSGTAKDFNSIPVGYEIKGKGTRQADGTIIATEIQTAANGTQTYENDIKNATNEMEQQWVKAGRVFEEDEKGKKVDMGK